MKLKTADEKRNKPRGENANAGIIVCKGHAETLKTVIVIWIKADAQCLICQKKLVGRFGPL